MKRILLPLICFFLSVPVFAQMMPDSTVQICAYWQKGEKVEYECTRETTRIEPDGTSSVKDASSEVRIFEVIDATDSSYVLQTSYRDVFDSRLNLKMDISTEIVNKISEACVVQTLTDEFGAPETVLNAEEMAITMEKVVATVVDAVFAKCSDKELKAFSHAGMTKEMFVENYIDLTCNPEFITAACYKDVVPLLTFHGTRLKLSEVYNSVQQYILFDGQQVSGNMKFWVDTDESDSTFVVLRTSAVIDGESFDEALRSATKMALTAASRPSMSESEMNEMLEAVSGMTGSFEEYTATLIHLDTGWPVQYVAERHVRSSDSKGATVEEIVKSDINLKEE